MNELEELIRRGVDFTLEHRDGTIVMAAEHGFAMDCTLSTVLETVMQQERDQPPLSEAIANRMRDQRQASTPPARPDDCVLQLQFLENGKVLVWSDGRRSVAQVAHLLRVVATGFESGLIEQVE